MNKLKPIRDSLSKELAEDPIEERPAEGDKTIYELFWEGLIAHGKGIKFLADLKPRSRNNIGTAIGVTGLSWSFVVRKTGSVIRLYIERKDSSAENKKIFDKLHQHREEIEKYFLDDLIWDPKKGKLHCQINYRLSGGGWVDATKWNEVYSKMCDTTLW